MPQDANPLESETPAPFEQQPDEPPKHFEWFAAFLHLGPGRSLLGAAKFFYSKSGKVLKSNVAPPYWRKASEKWNWKGRAGAWDKVQREKRLAQIEERETAAIDRIFASVDKVLDRSEQVDKFVDFVLKYPKTEQATIDGQTVLMPGKWNFGTAIRAFQVLGESNKTAAELLGLLGTMERGRAIRQFSSDQEQQVMEARLRLEAMGYTIAAPEEGAGALSPTQLRHGENERLALMEAVVLKQVEAGVPGAVDRALRIAQRRATLNGLNQPFDPSKEENTKKRRDMSHFSDVELSILEEMLLEEET